MTTPFQTHCQDVKRHLFLFLALLGILFGITFYYSDQWLYLLMAPLIQIKHSNYFIITDLMEIFSLKLTGALLLSWVIMGLMGLFQGWWFVAPGLYKYENWAIGQILSLFVLLFGFSLYGMGGYLVPHLWCFFYGYETTAYPFLFQWTFEPKLANYILLFLTTLGWMTFVSQYPLVLFLLVKTHILTLSQLTRARKLIYCQLLLVASLLAPPDISSQLLIFVGLVAGTEGMIGALYILIHPA